MKFDGMKYILLATVAAPITFGAFADQDKVQKPAAVPAQPQAVVEAKKPQIPVPAAVKPSGVASMSVVAQKLKTCQFLVNGQYKQNAKYYICLCSASWCGPCRQEMPRIAKIYAETLKANPKIELIHFSYDSSTKRALAWAKENNVKFPVVKPKGGNPLKLKARGIPHMFIVRADGTVLKKGHPMEVFTKKNLKKLK